MEHWWNKYIKLVFLIKIQHISVYVSQVLFYQVFARQAVIHSCVSFRMKEYMKKLIKKINSKKQRTKSFFKR